MKLIVLTGLVSVEKIEIAQDLASFFNKQGMKVAVLDNVARLLMNPKEFSIPVQQIAGDITLELEKVLFQMEADVVILALHLAVVEPS